MKFLKERFPACDAFVLSCPADLFYLTGFFCADALLLSDERLRLVTDARYTTAAKAQANAEVVTVTGSYAEGVCALAKAADFHTLGFQEHDLSAADYLAFSKEFTMVPLGNAMQEKRAVKTPSELSSIRIAQAITDKAWGLFLKELRPGKTEKQLARQLNDLLFDCGADSLAFDTIAASGENGACPHAVPSDKTLKKGELITFDFGARKNGWCSDMTRTVTVGQINSQLQTLYQTVLTAHQESAAVLTAGLPGLDADAVARQVFASVGMEAYFSHSLGHGVGIQIHELPLLSRRNTSPLPEGSVVTVEPGLYVPSLGGVRIENMYAITRDGAINLTAADKKLLIL